MVPNAAGLLRLTARSTIGRCRAPFIPVPEQSGSTRHRTRLKLGDKLVETRHFSTVLRENDVAGKSVGLLHCFLKRVPLIFQSRLCLSEIHKSSPVPAFDKGCTSWDGYWEKGMPNKSKAPRGGLYRRPIT